MSRIFWATVPLKIVCDPETEIIWKEWSEHINEMWKNIEIYEFKAEENQMKENSLLTEAYREYDFQGRTYRIDNPVSLFTREGGTTHRVLDSEGIVHCVPIPGSHGCVLRWKNKDATKPCEF